MGILRSSPATVVALAVACIGALWVAAAPPRARACSDSMPVRHRVWIVADGSAWALADPEGRLVHLTQDGAARVVRSAGRHAHQISDLDGTGSQLVTLHLDWSDDSLGAACEATWGRLDVTPTARGRTRRGRRIDLSDGYRIQVAPDGAHAVLVGSGRGVGRAWLIALRNGRVLRAIEEALDARWLDAAQLVLMDEIGALRIEPIAGGNARPMLSAPAEGTRRSMLGVDASGGETRVFVVEGPDEGPMRLRRLEVGAAAVRTHDARWTRSARWMAVRGSTVVVVASAPEGQHTGTGALSLLDASTGVERVRIEGQHGYTAASLSADERFLVVSSFGAPTGDEPMGYDPDAFLPTAVELIDLSAGRIVAAWGRPDRSRIVRPPAPPRR